MDEILDKIKADAMVVQSVICSKDTFESAEDASEWCRDHNFRVDKIDETETSYRFRQRDPGDFQQNSFRTIELTTGVQAVVGKLKGARAMNPKQKLASAKNFNAQEKSLTALVSTSGWDRTGERFASGAWETDQYLKNPVVLWAHNPTNPPIAKTIGLRETDQGLEADMVFDSGSERAMEIYRLYQEGFLSAFSVGFIPKAWNLEPIEGSQEKGVVFTKAELLEYSAVGIPANPGALVSREQAELITKALGPGMFKEIENPETHEKSFMVIGPEELEIISDQDPAPPSNSDADLEKSLKYLIDLSKTAKASGLDKMKLALVQQAVSVLSEIVEANSDGVSSETLNQLKEAVDAYAKTIGLLLPDSATLVQKVMAQIDKALCKR